MSDKFPIDEAQIVGLFMECVFYGMYLVTFGMCIRALLFDHAFSLKRKSDIRWGMLAIALAMGVFGTFDVAFGLRHNLDAFVFYKGPGGAAEEFSDIKYWVNIMKTVDYVAQTAIGDAVLIYRCWMVYNQRLLIVLLPIAMWIGSVVCSCLMIWVEATTTVEALLNESRIRPLLYSIVALTLVMNVGVTSLIVWRIWRVRRRTNKSSVHPGRLKHVMRIIIDSGLMYTVTMIIFFGTTLAENNAQYGVSDVAVQVIGIAFNLIIIRVSNGTASDGISFSTTTTTGGFTHPHHRHHRHRSHTGATTFSYPMQFINATLTHPTAFTVRTEAGVDVEVRRVVEQDRRVVKGDGPWKGMEGVDEDEDAGLDGLRSGKGAQVKGEEEYWAGDTESRKETDSVSALDV